MMQGFYKWLGFFLVACGPVFAVLPPQEARCVSLLLQVIKLDGSIGAVRKLKQNGSNSAWSTELERILLDGDHHELISKAELPKRVRPAALASFTQLSRLVHSHFSRDPGSIRVFVDDSNENPVQRVRALEAIGDLYAHYSPQDEKWDQTFGGNAQMSEVQRLKMRLVFYQEALKALNGQSEVAEDRSRISQKINSIAADLTTAIGAPSSALEVRQRH